MLELIDLSRRFGDVVALDHVSFEVPEGMVPLAGRLYSGAVLRIGAKVRLRDAWRSAS